MIGISNALSRNNNNPCLIRRVNDAVTVEKQAFPGIDGQAGGAGLGHGLNSLHADHGNIEAHILVGLGYFHDREMAA